MPQYDFYHDTVKNALIKDGWVITDDPFTIKFKGKTLFADLGAEKLFAAETSERKIVVEVKGFSSPSPMTELEKAVGQYNIYRTFLKRINPERKLYLAVDQNIYHNFFEEPAIQEIITDQRINLIVFNPITQEIIQWTS
jgi:hypothetical protein